MPADRGRINIDMFAARLQPAASRLLTPQSRQVEAIVRRASRGGTSLRVEETVGVLSRERYERPADISRETIQEQALAVAGGGGGSGGAGGPILSFPPIIRDGASNNTTGLQTGIAVMAGNVTIPDDGRTYDLIAIGEQSFGNFGSPAGYGELRLGGKASGWVGGSGSAWRGWAHTVVNGPYTNTTVSVAFWVKTDSGTLTYGGGRIDLFAIPRGGGGGTWNGGDVTLPTRFKNVTLSGRDASDSQLWAIAPSGRMDLEELFATRGLNIGGDGIIIARNAGGTTTFQVIGASGSTLVGGPLEVDGATSFDGAATLRGGANLFGRRADASQAFRFDPTTNTFTMTDTTPVNRLALFGNSGQVALYGTDGSTVNTSLSSTGAARFALTPTVGAAGSAVAVSLVGHTHTAASITDFTEAAQDAVAALLAAGTGVTLAYNDAANTLTITGTAGGGTTDLEAVRDAIGVALLGVGNVTVTVNDAADTITISTTATVNSTDAQLRDRATHTGTQLAATVSDLAEAVDDRVAALLVAGAGITKVYDDTAGTLTLTATGGGAGTRDYPITYVSATAPVEPRVGDFWLETSTPRPPSDDPHASLVISSTAPASPSLGDIWYQP